MEVTRIVINGIEITTLDKPIGLEVIKLALDRDFQYSCIDTKIEAELKFYCASGKEQLDAEYERKGVEGSGYIEITDICGTNEQTYQFNLDFTKYNNQGTFTTIGLIDVNSLWKQDLNKEVNLDKFTNGSPTNFASDFYVRNLPLIYEYISNKWSSIERAASPRYAIDEFFAAGTAPSANFYYNIYPKTDVNINELEDGFALNAESLFRYGDGTTGRITITAGSGKGTIIQPNGTVISAATVHISEVESQPIFENKLAKGSISIDTTGSTDLILNTSGTTSFNALEIYEFTEFISIGNTYDNPRLVFKNELNISSLIVTSVSPTLSYINAVTPTKAFNYTGEIFINESVWVWYDFRIAGISLGVNNYELRIQNYNLDINRDLNIEYQITENTSSTISSSSDVEPYHTLTSAYYGQTILNHIFNTAENLGQMSCYSDLWFSKGDLMRGKINKADTIVKPSDFFRELEKVVCCGLGYFYDTSTPQKRLMSVYDFYSDNLVPSQYQFGFDDLIDGKIELAPFLSPYYKEVQIGYSNSKDSPKDYCKQNNYSINNISENTYSKISDFIASQYIITRALRLGTQDEELEFDNNIFILSGGQLGTYNATLSQTSGVLQDNIFTQPLNTAGINRRYATALNLFRHLYKWGFSLFADKTELKVPKYEGNNIYDYEIRDTTGSSTNPYYHGLSLCKLPLDNYAKVDRTIEDIYNDFIQSGLYVPTQITFKTANLSSLDLIAMRAHQYDLFSVTDGVNTYYGNLISANLEEDITEIKLLRRFKNRI